MLSKYMYGVPIRSFITDRALAVRFPERDRASHSHWRALLTLYVPAAQSVHYSIYKTRAYFLRKNKDCTRQRFISAFVYQTWPKGNCERSKSCSYMALIDGGEEERHSLTKATRHRFPLRNCTSRPLFLESERVVTEEGKTATPARVDSPKTSANTQN